MSEIKARAKRRAFCLGSCTMNGLTGRRGPVGRFPGAVAPAAGDAGAAGGGAGRGGGGAALGAVIVGVGAGDAGRAGAKGGRAIGAAGAAGAAGRLGGAAGGAITGRGAAIGGAARGGGGGAAAAPAPSELTAKTLLQTLQRARRPPAGTLAGSTRYTVSHDGQVTFTPTSSRSSSFPSPAH